MNRNMKEEVSWDPGQYKEVEQDGRTILKIRNSYYEKELLRLQMELVKLQEWVKQKGLRVVVIFEGRDAAGKGGGIKRITARMNPRLCRFPRTGKNPSGISSGM